MRVVRLVLAAAMLVAGTVVAAPARATGSDCLPAGGADRPFTTDAGVTAAGADGGNEPPALVLNGGGWGHGVGMSQYAAKGAALLGCDVETMLTTFYPGTQVQQADLPDTVRVGLVQLGERASVEAEDGPVTWELVGCKAAGDSSTDDPDCTTHPSRPEQPQGSTWTVTSEPDGRYTIRSGEATVWEGGDRFALLRARHEGTTIRVPEVGRRFRWGYTEFDSYASDGGRLYVVQTITPAPDGSAGAVQRYLWGVAEIPSGWPAASLEAQAVAARSYAKTRLDLGERPACRCHLYASVKDQVYAGWDKQYADATYANGAWKAAVDVTDGRVLSYTGEDGSVQIVDAFYSSSHGGRSEDVAHVWGAEIPYLQAVDSSRWENAPGVDNPYGRWTVGIGADRLAAAFELAEVDDLEIVARGPGGRPTRKDGGGVVVHGTDVGGQEVTRRFSGEALRSRLELRSSLVYEPDDVYLPVARLAGDRREVTAVAVSERGWYRSDTVVIARSDDPADALAGTGLAGKLDAPLLITGPEGLHPAATAEIRRLGAKRAVLLGGEQALTPAVEQHLRDSAGVTDIERVAGPTRVETAVAIAERLAPAPGGRAVVVRGLFAEHPDRQWADSLAVAGLTARRAADKPWPVLVVSDSIHPATAAALEHLEVKQVTIAGGPATVPEAVDERLAELGYEVDRLAGATRYETSRLAVEFDGPPTGPLVLATGDRFPDGLAAGALTGRLGGSLLLVPSGELDTAAVGHREWIRAHAGSFTQLLVVGGPAAVSDGTLDAVRTAVVEGRNAGV